MFERNVFYECSEHSGLEVAKFEDTLATLPSSALQPKPLPSILKTIKGKKNTTRRVSVGVPVYHDDFSRYNNQDVEEYMAEISHCYRHTQHLAKKEMRRVSKARALAKSVIRFTGKQVLPAFLEPLFDSCCHPATLEDFDVFINACTEYENKMNHAATTIQCAFRVPPTASFAKLSLWKRLYNAKTKTVEEMKIKSETKPVIVATKLRSYKPSIESKKNRATRQTTLSSMRKTKKAANLARRRGLVAVTSLPIIQAPVRALVPCAPFAPIKKKNDSSITTPELSQLTTFEHLVKKYMSIQFTSILSDLTSIIEVDEPIEITSILPKCNLHPIKEVQEPVDLEAAASTTIQALIRGALTRSTCETPKVEAATTTEPEEIKVDATSASDSTITELCQIFPVEQEPVLESTTTGELDDEFSQPHSVDADVDIVFEQADEPLLDLDAIPEATPRAFPVSQEAPPMQGS